MKIFIFLVMIIFLSSTIYASESCFIHFTFQEHTESISYLGLENLYADLNFLADINTDNRVPYLALFDSGSNEIARYSFYQADILSQGNELSVVVPYNANIHLGRVLINNTLLLEFNPVGIACERDCKIPGENGTIGERCCDNYLESWVSSDKFTCISCGDGVCSKYENKYSCWKDCRPSVDEMNCSNGYTPSYYGCVEGDICGNNVIESGEECDDGDIFDDDGCSHDCKLEECRDHDFSNINWENSLLNSSYVFFNFNRSYDSCKDNNTLIENYCGINLFRWDFWNINEKVAKSKEVVCDIGCFDGACLENPEIPPQNNTTDLPEEPEAPSSIFKRELQYCNL